MAAGNVTTSSTENVRVEGGLDWRERLFGVLRRRGALFLLLIVIVAASFAFERFLTFGNLQNVAVQSAFLGLIVVGMTFVIISGGIDLSVGSQLALGGVLAAYAAQVAWPLAIFAPLVVCGFIGLLQGTLIAKAGMAPFIVTLAGLLGIRGLALAITDDQNIGLEAGSPFLWFSQGSILGLATPVWIVGLAFIIGGILLIRSSYGEAIFAVGGSEDSARLMGVNVDRTKILAYTTSGALAGLAGALLAARLSSGQPTVGVAWELDAISAVVVGGALLTGGAGTMSGSLAGVLLLGIIQNVINQIGTLGAYTQQVVSGTFLVVVVVTQAYLTRKERI